MKPQTQLRVHELLKEAKQAIRDWEFGALGSYEVAGVLSNVGTELRGLLSGVPPQSDG